MSRLLPAAFALFLLAAAARAETLRVPQDFATLQAAVNVAAGGDTILLKAGSYDETVSIDGKDDLVLRGSGKAAIAPSTLSTAVIIANSGHIQLVNLRFPSPIAPAFFAQDSSHITLSRCRFEPQGPMVAPTDTPQAGGVSFASVDDLLVDRCRFVGTQASGLGLGGTSYPVNGVVVQRCRFEATGSHGVDIVEATDVLIAHNVFEDLGYDGVRVGISNTFENMTIEHNSFRNMAFGIEIVTGAGPLHIEHNVVRELEGTAIVTGVVGAEVEFNLVRDAGGDGILLGTSGAARHNNIRDCGGSGVVATGSLVEVIANKVRGVGASSAFAAIEVFGVSAVITDNVVKDAAGTAVALTGNLATVSRNKVTDPDDDGFHNDGDTNVYDHNTSLRAGGDGFELIGTGMDLKFDKASGSAGFDLYDHSPGQNEIGGSCHFGTVHP